MQPERDRAATARVRGLMEEPSYVLDLPTTPRWNTGSAVTWTERPIPISASSRAELWSRRVTKVARSTTFFTRRGFANAGDDAILESIQQAIQAVSDDVSVTVLSNDPELTQKQYGLEAIPRFRVLRVFSALRRSDALLSGGGSLLQDTTSTRSLLYYLSVIR